MPVRLVEWQLPYSWGEGIQIDENKVISLNLRDENNLIIYDAQDDEIYVDLQLPDGIKPTDAFPVGVTTGRVLVADGWDKAGTIISAKTTSWDVIKLLYADDWTLWIDNGTGTFKQIYFKADVDAIITTLTAYINAELAKKQNWVVSATAPSNPAQWDLWYDTTSNSMKVYDWTNWNAVGTGWWWSDIEYVTQAEYEALLPWALTDNKHYFIYEEEVWPTPTPPFTPWADTIVYYPFDTDWNDYSWNGYNFTTTNSTQITTVGWVTCLDMNGSTCSVSSIDDLTTYTDYTWLTWIYVSSGSIDWAFTDNGQGWWWSWFRVWQNKQVRWGNPVNTYSTFSSFSSNQWVLFWIVMDNWEWSIYQNWVKTVLLWSGWLAPYNNISPFYFSGKDGVWAYGYISNFIIEKRAWTSQEFQDYFEATKSNYWIS